MEIKTKIVSCHTANSKPVKQEVNGTVILSPLVFPGVRNALGPRAYTINFLFLFANRLIQTSQTGGQWYSDTSPFSIPLESGQMLRAAPTIR